MRKRTFSNILSLGMVLILLFSLESSTIPGGTAYAVKETETEKEIEKDLSQGITIDDEYLIPDTLGYFTYYVVVATNNTGSDIAISADFIVKDKKGNILRKANDYSDAVKDGQQFMLYGQFSNSVVENAASYEYAYTVAATDKCAYNAVILETETSGDELVVTATNTSKLPTQSVVVRTLFLKKGKAVGFDTVNIADKGTDFSGGSTVSQVIGNSAPDYDSFITTYTTVGMNYKVEDI